MRQARQKRSHGIVQVAASWVRRVFDLSAETASVRDEKAAARLEARRIVDNDPNLAIDLEIGRIDIPNREFPDGGLIDVNNVPAYALERITGLPGYICRRITTNRPTVGGYESAAEMSETLHLPPHLLDTIADRLVFLPVYHHAP